jgi:ABC-type dipeptide/oligopeptide/nickel transport system permease component
MRQQTQATCLFLSLAILAIFFTFTFTFKMLKTEKFGNRLPSLEERSFQIFQATKNTLNSSLVNSQDPNTTYQIWLSNMAKQGLGLSVYSNPQVFNGVVSLSPLSVENVAYQIYHYYDLELRSYATLPVHHPITSVCSN